MKRFNTFFAVVVAVAVVLAGCDVLSSSDPVEGQMRVLMTDAPADIAEAHVTIVRVELVGGEGGPLVLSDEHQEFDLLTLQDGVTAELADVTIPEGSYHQLRIIVDEEAYLLFEDGSETTLKVPSGTETGIKIQLPEFDIADDSDAVEVLVDFDVEQSFVWAGASGKYLFKPVIKPEYIEINGVFNDLSDDDDEEGDDNGDDEDDDDDENDE